MNRTKTAVTIIFALFIFAILGCMIFMTKNINITTFNYKNVKVNNQFEITKMSCTSQKITLHFDGDFLDDTNNVITVYCYDANSNMITIDRNKIKVDKKNNKLRLSSKYIEYISEIHIINNKLNTILKLKNIRSNEPVWEYEKYN